MTLVLKSLENKAFSRDFFAYCIKKLKGDHLDRPQITDKGIRTRVLTLLSSLQEVASVVEYRSKKE